MIRVAKLPDGKIELQAGEGAEFYMVCTVHDARRLLAAMSVVLELPLTRAAQKAIDIEPQLHDAPFTEQRHALKNLQHYKIPHLIGVIKLQRDKTYIPQVMDAVKYLCEEWDYVVEWE